MNRILLVILLIASALLPAAASAIEYFPSPSAVKHAHPNAWPVWKNLNGEKVWIQGERHHGRARSRVLADHRGARTRAAAQAREMKEAELRSLFPERTLVVAPLTPGCPQARINEGFAVMGMAR